MDYARIQDFYEHHRDELGDDPEFLRGTIETSRGIARFRARAEARHLARVLKTEPGQRVLDLGAGTGRWSVFFAQRGARVTAVELAPSLAAGAQRNAERLGLDIDVRVGSILQPPLAARERFDVVHIGNVLMYVDEADLPRVRELARAHTTQSGVLVVREAVDANGPSKQSTPEYSALVRRPEAYPQLFAPDFRLLYERTSVSHLIPRGSSTTHVVQGMRGARWQKPLVEHVLPLLGYVDYHLLQLEERLRASPLRSLLGDAGVVQRFYIFARRS